MSRPTSGPEAYRLEDVAGRLRAGAQDARQPQHQHRDGPHLAEPSAHPAHARRQPAAAARPHPPRPRARPLPGPQPHAGARGSRPPAGAPPFVGKATKARPHRRLGRPRRPRTARPGPVVRRTRTGTRPRGGYRGPVPARRGAAGARASVRRGGPAPGLAGGRLRG